MDAKTDNVVSFMPGQKAVARTNPKKSAGDGTDEYYACGVSLSEEAPGNEVWFRIHGIFAQQDASIEMCRYADILKVYSPLPGYVSIVFDDCSFVLEGENLTEVIILLQDRKLRALYPFDPDMHQKPADGNAIIRSITRYEDES